LRVIRELEIFSSSTMATFQMHLVPLNMNLKKIVNEVGLYSFITIYIVSSSNTKSSIVIVFNWFNLGLKHFTNLKV